MTNKFSKVDQRLFDRLPIEIWQLALSYLPVQDILPHVPRCCRFLNDVVWGPWSAALLWREIDMNLHLAWKCTYNDPVLMHAIEHRAPLKHIVTLIKGSADLNHPGYHSWTPLMCAARVPNIDVVRYLLDAHADINARNMSGNTALEIVHYTLVLYSGSFSVDYDMFVADLKEVQTILLEAHQHARQAEMQF